MQASCPQCAHKILIDDAKIPDRPFSVKCPKCQGLIKLPGRAPVATVLEPEPAPAPAVTPPAPAVEEMRAQMMAQIRREMTTGAAPAGRALVALPDRGLAGAITLVLTRQGMNVDTIENWEEGARLLEQGVYDVVVTARIAGTPAKGESLYQRINRLSPDGRRHLFLILVGDEFKSGDGLQAFTVLADLVLHSRDAAAADALLRSTMAERTRLYQAYLDARHRHEMAAG